MAPSQVGSAHASVITAQETAQLKQTALDASKVGLLEGIAWPTAGEAKFWDRAPRSAPAPPLTGSSSMAPPEQDANPMHIVHITAEMAPIAKVSF